jgi:hypothetical protein
VRHRRRGFAGHELGLDEGADFFLITRIFSSKPSGIFCSAILPIASCDWMRTSSCSSMRLLPSGWIQMAE